MGDVGSNLIHRKRLEPEGVAVRGVRIDRESEFVTSSDTWFRPCQFANGPDGALYVADMYREVIEHPKSLPEVIKQHLDLTSGRDRGRIYRIVPEDFRRPKLPNLAEFSVEELVAELAHENGWRRETAARLLSERQDRAAIAALEKLAGESHSPFARMHALYALAGLEALSAETLLPRLGDSHARVREHAVRLAEGFAAESPAIRESLYRLVEVDDPNLRYQLAFTLGDVPGERTTTALAALARRAGGDRWMRLAILSSAAGRRGPLVAELTADASVLGNAALHELLGELAEQAGRSGAQDEIAPVLRAVEKVSDAGKPLAAQLVARLSRGLGQSGSTLREQLGAGRGGELLRDMLRRAAEEAIDAELPEARRVEAVTTLALEEFAAARPVLVSLLEGRQPQAVQTAALAALARFRNPEVAEIVLSHWSGMSPAVRREAGEALFAREEHLSQLLEAVEKQRVKHSEFDPARLTLLREHPNAKIAARAREVLGTRAVGARAAVVESHQDVLELAGDVERGRMAFRKVCAACHRFEGHGHALAPDLAAIRNRGAEGILLGVLDPNREVNPQYQNYVVITTAGRSLSGIVSAETATSITLAWAEGQSEVILRRDIEMMQSTGLSIMPEGLESQLTKQELADVIAYLLATP